MGYREFTRAYEGSGIPGILSNIYAYNARCHLVDQIPVAIAAAVYVLMTKSNACGHLEVDIEAGVCVQEAVALTTEEQPPTGGVPEISASYRIRGILRNAGEEVGVDQHEDNIADAHGVESPTSPPRGRVFPLGSTPTHRRVS